MKSLLSSLWQAQFDRVCKGIYIWSLHKATVSYCEKDKIENFKNTLHRILQSAGVQILLHRNSTGNCFWVKHTPFERVKPHLSSKTKLNTMLQAFPVQTLGKNEHDIQHVFCCRTKNFSEFCSKGLPLFRNSKMMYVLFPCKSFWWFSERNQFLNLLFCLAPNQMIIWCLCLLNLPLNSQHIKDHSNTHPKKAWTGCKMYIYFAWL